MDALLVSILGAVVGVGVVDWLVLREVRAIHRSIVRSERSREPVETSETAQKPPYLAPVDRTLKTFKRRSH